MEAPEAEVVRSETQATRTRDRTGLSGSATPPSR
jgi:hypothetical protein